MITTTTTTTTGKTRRRRRPFVVKRYRSARGFKRLLYEYTRGDGGINGVALSCRRYRGASLDARERIYLSDEAVTAAAAAATTITTTTTNGQRRAHGTSSS